MVLTVEDGEEEMERFLADELDRPSPRQAIFTPNELRLMRENRQSRDEEFAKYVSSSLDHLE